jgi:8-oxo-dGTP diphosphatase
VKYTYDYPRPLVSVDNVIFRIIENQQEVLLIKRKKPPYQSMWAFPGGFIEMEETLLESAARELREETGLKGIELTQFYTFGDPGRDPRARVITVAFYGFVDYKHSKVSGMDDAAEARWFKIDHIPGLAFDHDIMLKIAVESAFGKAT